VAYWGAASFGERQWHGRWRYFGSSRRRMGRCRYHSSRRFPKTGNTVTHFQRPRRWIRFVRGGFQERTASRTEMRRTSARGRIVSNRLAGRPVRTDLANSTLSRVRQQSLESTSARGTILYWEPRPDKRRGEVLEQSSDALGMRPTRVAIAEQLRRAERYWPPADCAGSTTTNQITLPANSSQSSGFFLQHGL